MSDVKCPRQQLGALFISNIKKTLAFCRKVWYHNQYLCRAMRPLIRRYNRKDMSHMTTPQLVLSIIYFIVALALIAVVMLQSGKSAGLSGAIGGGADTFLSKNKAKSADARLARMTKWVAVVFMLLTLIICLL